MFNIKEGFGLRLRELRKNRGLTQEKLAEMVDLNPRQLTRIESGENFPSSDALAKISIALQIDLKCLFDYDWGEQKTFLATGTDDRPYLRLVKRNENVDIKSFLKGKDKEIEVPKQVSADESEASMIRIAQNVKKPVTVEYFSDGKRINIKTYFPNGKIETLYRDVNQENKFYSELSEKLKDISNDENKLEFVDLAMKALDNPKSLSELKTLIKGIELAQKYKS